MGKTLSRLLLLYKYSLNLIDLFFQTKPQIWNSKHLSIYHRSNVQKFDWLLLTPYITSSTLNFTWDILDLLKSILYNCTFQIIYKTQLLSSHVSKIQKYMKIDCIIPMINSNLPSLSMYPKILKDTASQKTEHLKPFTSRFTFLFTPLFSQLFTFSFTNWTSNGHCMYNYNRAHKLHQQ